MQKGRLRLMLTFRRLICLLLALGLLTISAVAEMPNPTLDPNANPYDVPRFDDKDYDRAAVHPQQQP